MPLRDHLSTEELALLLEDRLDADELVWAESHLRGCLHCQSAFTDAVTVLLQRDARPKLDPSLRRLALDVASPAASATPRKSSRLVRGRRGTWWAPFAITGTAVAAVVLALWLAPEPKPSASSIIPPSIKSAVELASAQGMVLPGGEAGADLDLPRYRAADGSVPEIADELQRLREGIDPSSLEETRWMLAAYIASGRLGIAHSYAASVQRRFPADDDLQVLQAALAYRESDVDAAEKLLRRVIERDENHLVARFDLGFLLDASDRHDEAADQFRAVVRAGGDTALAKRARSLLGE